MGAGAGSGRAWGAAPSGNSRKESKAVPGETSSSVPSRRNLSREKCCLSVTRMGSSGRAANLAKVTRRAVGLQVRGTPGPPVLGDAPEAGLLLAPPAGCAPEHGVGGRLDCRRPARDQGGMQRAAGGREDREGRSRWPADSRGAAGHTASSSGGAGGRRHSSGGGGRPGLAHRGPRRGVSGRSAACAGARDARAAGRGARTTGRPAGAPLSLPPGLRRRSLTGGRPRAGVRVRHAEVCRLLRGSPPGPRLGPAAAAETAAGTARARGEAGPSGCSGERGRRARRRTKPPFFPPPPPLPSPGLHPPPDRDAGGSGRSRDRLPSLRRFPAAVARARTSEVGHPPGDEKPRTRSREAGQAGREGRSPSRIARPPPEGWKLGVRGTSLPVEGSGGRTQTWTIGERMKREWEVLLLERHPHA